MQLNPNSLLVRFAYSLASGDDRPSGRYGPRGTTLCAFFWRAFVFVPLAWLAIGAAVALFAAVAYRSVRYHGWFLLEAITMSAIFLAIGAGLTEWGSRLKERRRSRQWDPTVKKPVQPSALDVFVEGVKATKKKFCPLIDFVDDTKERA